MKPTRWSFAATETSIRISSGDAYEDFDLAGLEPGVHYALFFDRWNQRYAAKPFERQHPSDRNYIGRVTTWPRCASDGPEHAAEKRLELVIETLRRRLGNLALDRESLGAEMVFHANRGADLHQRERQIADETAETRAAILKLGGDPDAPLAGPRDDNDLRGVS